MPIELDADGQDWRVWEGLREKKGSPKKDSEITSGYWRAESSKGWASPVRTLFDEGMMLVTIGDADPIDRDCGEDWHRFCTNFWPKVRAVEYDAIVTALETGFWPDGLPTSKRDAMGANEGPEDSVDRMIREANENIAKADALAAKGGAKTQDEADAAAILKANLTSPKAALEAAHKQEKEPHLEAGRAVDRKYLDLIKLMKKSSDTVHTSVIKPFLDEQERVARIAREAAQKVADDANEAARKAVEAEKGAPVSDDDWKAAAPAAVTVTSGKVSAGVKGARASLKDVRYGKMDDPIAFATALISGSFSGEIMDFLQQTATRMARKNPDMKDGARIYPGVLMEVRRE